MGTDMTLSGSLCTKSCTPCEGGVPPLGHAEVEQLRSQVSAWSVANDLRSIFRRFEFKNYYETMAFVNAVAWIANTQDHHPDLEVGYNKCRVHYSTHAVKGLSQNDFICAAKIEQLFA